MRHAVKYVTFPDLTTSCVSNRIPVYAPWFNSHHPNLNCRFLSPGGPTTTLRQHADLLCSDHRLTELWEYFVEVVEIIGSNQKPDRLVLLTENHYVHIGNNKTFTADICFIAQMQIFWWYDVGKKVTLWKSQMRTLWRPFMQLCMHVCNLSIISTTSNDVLHSVVFRHAISLLTGWLWAKHLWNT